MSDETPRLIIRCSCGAGQSLELQRGAVKRYVGPSFALASVFRQLHESHGGKVTEVIIDPVLGNQIKRGDA